VKNTGERDEKREGGKTHEPALVPC
jgi:hypothetical protein